MLVKDVNKNNDTMTGDRDVQGGEQQEKTKMVEGMRGERDLVVMTTDVFSRFRKTNIQSFPVTSTLTYQWRILLQDMDMD